MQLYLLQTAGSENSTRTLKNTCLSEITSPTGKSSSRGTTPLYGAVSTSKTGTCAGTSLPRACSPCLCTSHLTGSTSTGMLWMWTTIASSTWGPQAPGNCVSTPPTALHLSQLCPEPMPLLLDVLGWGRSRSQLWLVDHCESRGSLASKCDQSVWKNRSPHPDHEAPTGTLHRSPFHADIFRSFSWSVNICGRKKWLLFPPGQEEALRDCHGGLPYDVTAPEFWDSHQHPMLEHCNPPLEVTQEAGEMLFVPSGWHHQVHNLEDTISINHNWVNGCNLANMWHFLQQELCAVQQEVSEWRDTMPDWHSHCQVIMKSCSGINFEEFYCFLKIIAERRLLLAKKIGSSELECGEGSGLGPQQVIFDIGRIAEVLASVVVNPDFQRVDTSIFSLQPEDLLQQLKDVLAAMESV
ncbi:2-oxoglutarate and iron-dependent oxygenase JMJD4 isoform X3 [Saccopteryx leptura]|uniref:2-oxoglutarate and iron-dependent oxygenase JMJD4 isoform X3 n=1 Tax=Saccopteryx leptura TaxID=249018 RepID=UPI00339C5278